MYGPRACGNGLRMRALIGTMVTGTTIPRGGAITTATGTMRTMTTIMIGVMTTIAIVTEFAVRGCAGARRLRISAWRPRFARMLGSAEHDAGLHQCSGDAFADGEQFGWASEDLDQR